MKLLIDTYYLIAISRRSLPVDHPKVHALVADEQNTTFVSVCSLWELAIKTGLGKLETGLPFAELPLAYEAAGFTILDINRHHALARLDPEPATRDPFDRMLLAQCKVEDMMLVTHDRALLSHPLAWRGLA